MSVEGKLFGRHHDLFLLLVGFFFTSVVGAALGSYFQNRSWEYQERAKAMSSEREAATKTFEELSKLMDRRIYRMRQLSWKARDHSEATRVASAEALKSYSQVLFEWNDALNRNQALVLRYFGTETADGHFTRIHQAYKKSGSCLEKFYKERTGVDDSPGGRPQPCPDKADYDSIASMLEGLETQIYEFNVKMVKQIQEGEVGAFHPDFKK